MTSKPQKQPDQYQNEKQKKLKKHKNPYNINISFNINNPKKVISNQINKTIKVNHYSFIPQDQLHKPHKINISKVLNPSAKSHSSSLTKSKDLFKQDYFKDLNKYECYLENPCHTKKHKKSKSKPYDIQTKSKSDFTYSTSLLSMPFPGNDPLPDAAVKKLNKMKKYFLQKIGSMDISASEDTVQQCSDLINQSKNLKTSELKLYDSKNQRKQNNSNKFQDKDEVMTDKLSEYQYQNLISYENQNEQKQNEEHSKSKEIFDYEQNDTFPQLVLENLNSMTIKNQYLRHHSKFLSQNMDLFKNQSQSKKQKKANKPSFEELSADIKSKIINPFDDILQKGQRKSKKQGKSKLLMQNNQSQSKAMKEKIKIIQEILLKSDSSKSILKIGQKSEKSLINKVEAGSRVQDFYKKDIKKEYIIKTQIELPKDLVNEIKKFECDRESKECIKEQKIQESVVRLKDEKQFVDRMSYMQFLSNRDDQIDRKETSELIQGYIDLLQEHLNMHHETQNRQKSQTFSEVPSATQIRYIESSDRSDSYQIYPELSASRIQQHHDPTESYEDPTSEVNSYVYGDKEPTSPISDINYSPQRNQKIQLQKQMRQELTKRLTNQFIQKQKLNDEDAVKIILNSNLMEHSVNQNNSDLEYRKKTQDVSEAYKETHSYEAENAQKYEEIPEENINQKFTHEMESLLGFIKQNINFNCADKKVLSDLYEKLMKISKPQTDFAFKPPLHTQAQANDIDIRKKVVPLQIPSIQTPKKLQNIVKKPNLHKRSYSTQKDTAKVPTNITESNDINIWDMILVQERLNKKYNEITYEKERQLFEIQTDPVLTYDQYKQKVDELENWQNQAKKQILQAKKEIKVGIMNLRKILTPQSKEISFKTKSFSEKNLIPKFNQSFNAHLIEGLDKVFKKKQKNTDQTKNYAKVSVNLDSIFTQEPSKFDKKLESPNSEEEYEENQKGRLRLTATKSKQKNLQNQENQFEDQCIVPQVQLFRTGSSRYKDLLENHENESIGSSKSSNSSQNYNENIYSQNNEQKQDFIDLLKVQRYKLGDFHELNDEFEAESPEDAISKIPETFSETTILEPKKISIENSNITQEDKVDICEFILLDLCIEMYQETLDLEDTQIKKGMYKNSSMHRIMKDVFAFIKKEKKKPKKKGPKIGIHTELQTVKDYIQKIKIYVQTLPERGNVLLSESSENTSLISRINSPIGPTAIEILKTMRFYEDDIFQSKEQILGAQFAQNQGLNSLVLPVYVFTDFEEKLQEEKQFVFDTYFEDAEKQKNRLAFLKNVTHVHHKALFDALNQMLDFERPWGIWGKPFPWKSKIDRIKILSQENLQTSLKKSCDKVIECAMYMCGLLIDKQESLVKNTSVSQTYIEEVKEDRMSKMIINDFIENESRFSFLDDEETQILLETSYVIWLLLIQEAVKDIHQIKLKGC